MNDYFEERVWAIAEEAATLIDGAGTTEEVQRIARIALTETWDKARLDAIEEIERKAGQLKTFTGCKAKHGADTWQGDVFVSLTDVAATLSTMRQETQI